MYHNGAVQTITCPPEFKQPDLRNRLRQGMVWFEFEQGKYVNLDQVMTVTVLPESKPRS